MYTADHYGRWAIVDRRNFGASYHDRKPHVPLSPTYRNIKPPKEKEKRTKRFIKWIRDCYRKWKGQKRCYNCCKRERRLNEYFLESLCKECCERKDKTHFKWMMNRCILCKTQKEICCC